MDDFFRAHLSDLASRCDRGDIGATGFLNPAEQYEAASYLKTGGMLCEVRINDDGTLAENSEYPDGGYLFWGGYKDAERKRLFTLPAYLFYTASNVKELLTSESGEDAVSAVLIEGSGYVNLTHRDYMGALLNAGVKRESLGDIVCSDTSGEPSGRCAVLFALPSVAKWLCEDIEAPYTVGRDKVKLSRAVLPESFGKRGGFKRMDGVIASSRLDCAAAFLCGISREKAKLQINAGNVQLNYEAVTSPDREIKEGDIVSVRGFGRFSIESFDGRTKKDRLRISAVKYI